MVRDGAAGASSGVRVPRSVAAISRHEGREAARERAAREPGDDVEPADDLRLTADEVRVPGGGEDRSRA